MSNEDSIRQAIDDGYATRARGEIHEPTNWSHEEQLRHIFSCPDTGDGRRNRRVTLRWIFAWLLILGIAVLIAPPADATPVDDYRIENAERICNTLDKYPTFDGILGIGMRIVEESGMTKEQAGETIARAVIGWCPRHEELVENFAAQGEVEFKR